MHCYVFCDRNISIGFPDWTPESAHMLVLHLYKSTNGTVSVKSVAGHSLFSNTTTSSVFRQMVFQYVPGASWLVENVSVSQPLSVIGTNRYYLSMAGLPDDSRFAPVILQE